MNLYKCLHLIFQLVVDILVFAEHNVLLTDPVWQGLIYNQRCLQFFCRYLRHFLISWNTSNKDHQQLLFRGIFLISWNMSIKDHQQLLFSSKFYPWTIEVLYQYLMTKIITDLNFYCHTFFHPHPWSLTCFHPFYKPKFGSLNNYSLTNVIIWEGQALGPGLQRWHRPVWGFHGCDLLFLNLS